MIRKGPNDNIIETFGEKGGEIGIWPDGQSAINGPSEHKQGYSGK